MGNNIGTGSMDGRSPHGERGLKCAPWMILNVPGCRSPHGERGLKSAGIDEMKKHLPVAPPTGSVD